MPVCVLSHALSRPRDPRPSPAAAGTARTPGRSATARRTAVTSSARPMSTRSSPPASGAVVSGSPESRTPLRSTADAVRCEGSPRPAIGSELRGSGLCGPAAGHDDGSRTDDEKSGAQRGPGELGAGARQVRGAVGARPVTGSALVAAAALRAAVVRVVGAALGVVVALDLGPVRHDGEGP